MNFDESFSYRMAEFGFGEIWTRTANDTHPPLYYWLLQMWQGVFGTSILSARSLSVVLGTGTVATMYLFVAEVCRGETRVEGSFDSPSKTHGNGGFFGAVWSRISAIRADSDYAAGLAAFFVCFSPMQSLWSARVRMYSLAAFLAVLLSWLFVRTLRKPLPVATDWIPCSIAAICLLYTHNYGLFTIVAMYVYAVGHAFLTNRNDDRKARFERVWPVLVSAFVVYQVWSPWLLVVLEQRVRVTQSFWSRPLEWSVFGAAFTPQFLTELGDIDRGVAGQLLLQAIVVVQIILVLGRRKFDLYLALAVIIPILAAVVVSLTMRNIISDRYFVMFNLFALASLAILISRIRWPVIRHFVAIAIISGMLFQYSHFIARRNVVAAKQGMAEAVAFFDKLQRSAEPLVVGDPMLHVRARVYSSAPDTIRTFGNGSRYPFYVGTAVMSPSDYLDREAISEIPFDWVWTLERGQRSAIVKPGNGWKMIAEKQFQDFSVIVLRLYARENSRTVLELKGSAAVSS